MFAGFSPVLYVQVSPERVTVRNIRAQRTISEVPEVAIRQGPKKNIAAVGAEAAKYKGTANMLVMNPFAHPRSMVSDFTVAEQLLKAFVARALGSGIFRPSPKLLMHPLGDPLGGFTQVELRAFREMAIGAGASNVALWTGRNLTDEEILNGNFKSGEEFHP
jgi:rod shape-determining protein MreB and related proteins